MLIQLIYISAATRSFGSHELPSLLTKTRLKNEILGVSGMLIYHEGSFLQILEGAPSTIDALYEHIARDPRHTQCEILVRTFIDRREFGEWSMGFVNTNEFRQAALLSGYQDFFGERASWRQKLEKPGMALRLLREFRSGAWHQTVQQESSFAAAACSE